MTENQQIVTYVLRCWREGSDDIVGDTEWRFSLEPLAGTDGRRRGFASLRRLFEFLSREIARTDTPVERDHEHDDEDD